MDEYVEKEKFVAEHLSPTLAAAMCQVRGAKYSRNPDTGHETVTVLYKNGYSKDICVSGDSLYAIIADVMKYVY